MNKRNARETGESVSDPDLIRSVLSGDREQFRPLMERYQQPIFGYLYRLLNQDKESAQDLSQSVFLKAYQNLASFDPSRPFSPWLYRIAHNEAANHLRSRARRREVGIDDAKPAQLADTGRSSPEARQEEIDGRDAVRRALERLKPKYREVLALYYYEEKSYDEIAEILERNPRTVATLIHRARRKMKALLEPS